MKNLLTLTLAFVALTCFISCGKDEPKPKFIIDETNLTEFGLKAYYTDNGYCCLRADEVPYYGMSFELVDGEYEVDESGDIVGYISGDLDLSVSMNTYNDDEEFATGEYNLLDDYGCANTEFNLIRIYAYWSQGDYSYASMSGTVDISRNGDKFTFDFDGMMYDLNDDTSPRSEGCPVYYGSVPISGRFSATFIEVNSLGR